ncbi:hypothetical protein Lbir_0742 [Legionella birminghamensis]|uniref:Lipoprotein NlpD n=1 Tax=Legionella birminghamensis TaxID=28083 RepID=A0A378I9J9_9GAMM|nr:peptidoglycan DD-metalloendopeptidase family protein [Legionella birminghamensis]KTC74709.1 hypothetical protein Lbir_0742 [Legionella birminghamensis]STX31512.1 lipoprotein NlpD [Legionella birminghamensis]
MPALLLLLLVCLLSGCAVSPRLAPVEDIRSRWNLSHKAAYVVQAGDTLYAIAFRFDKDVRQLAAYNHLRLPYSIRAGQIIRLTPNGQIPRSIRQPLQSAKAAKTTQFIKAKPISAVTSPVSYAGGSWKWPALGRVTAGFNPQQGKKGIDIAGSKGAYVYASGDGVVAYSGNGLSGYGNLIIIKHEGQFLTAYANNLKNKVNEGQKVKAGQIIAEMGVIDRQFWGVHFEIRKSGQPVNPMLYLQKKQ